MTTPTTNPKLDERLEDLVYDTPNHYGYPPDFEPDFKKAQQTILSDLSRVIQKLRTVNTYNVEGIKNGHYVEVSELETAIRAYVGVEL